MAGYTTYTRQKVNDHVRGKAAWAMPTNHIALFTTAPTDAGGGVETAYPGYARVVVAPADWAPASGVNGPNANRVSLPQCAGGGSVDIVAFGAFDQDSGGNLLWWSPCSLVVSTNITPSFPPYSGPGTGINVTLN